MTSRLETNETQRREFFADIAHEVRTPLSVIQGNIEGMLDGVYPRDDSHLEPLLDEVDLLARLLNDLETLATAEAGTLRLDRIEVDVRELLDDVREHPPAVNSPSRALPMVNMRFPSGVPIPISISSIT